MEINIDFFLILVLLLTVPPLKTNELVSFLSCGFGWWC